MKSSDQFAYTTGADEKSRMCVMLLCLFESIKGITAECLMSQGSETDLSLMQVYSWGSISEEEKRFSIRAQINYRKTFRTTDSGTSKKTC